MAVNPIPPAFAVNATTFKKADRLRKRSDFVRLSDIGQRVQNRYFIGVFAAGPEDRCRFGVTVTKRVGSAVVRNRIKRIAREAFRRNRSRIVGNWDINLIAKREAADLDSKTMFRSIETLLNDISCKKRH